ncbi:MAG TPA: hypothetical protein VMW73_01685 [Spirochaetia bacterium]|nr:hypothetical protein [Spirochaetia bacterium]
MRTILRRHHPFFGHAKGVFFLALGEPSRADAEINLPRIRGKGLRAERVLGRVCVVSNPRYNDSHGTSTAHFYFFDAVDDVEVFRALMDAGRAWARANGLTDLSGPMLFAGATGSGMLVHGFEHRAAMTMMGYNHAYYPRAMEALGFTKLLDFFSFSLDPDSFRLPERVTSVAEKVIARGRFSVMRFTRKRDLTVHAPEVAALYNETLADHIEGYPLTSAELAQVTKDLLTIARPDLMKILCYDGGIVGFLFGFADVSGAIRSANGRLTPLSIVRLLVELQRTRRLIINGAGILPQYQRLGGNALLYHELARTIGSLRGGRSFVHADLTQIAENTDLMLSDMRRLGVEAYKIHRMYTVRA